jgi:TonB-dependent starch-binding outer membrane protein SusC
MAKHVRIAYGALLVVCLLWMPVFTFGQATSDNDRITVIGEQIPLPDILKNITHQTGYYFVFDNNIIDNTEKLSVHFINVPWQEVISAVLTPEHLKWTLDGRRIFLEKEKAPELPPIAGIVTTEDGVPVPGVTVLIKGSAQGATTGSDGRFVLNHAPLHSVLHFSSIGFTPKDTVLEGKHFHVVRLPEAVNSLDAAVVIGYGESSRRLLTADVSTVSSTQIASHPVSNPLSALEGQVTGVLVTSTSGLPGAEVKLYIRGRNSIAAGNDPLFIIDGVPFDITPLNNIDELLGAARRISPFASINPADIESIDILKDADATAIYGSRGANGVVLITTKKGKAGAIHTDVSIYRGYGRATGFLNMLNTPQYLAMRREAFQNDGVTPTVERAPDLLLWDTTRNVNWERRLTNGTAGITNAQATVSGGTGNTTYLFSGNYYNEGTVLPASLRYRRGGAHVSLQHHTRDQRFEVTFTGIYTGDANHSIANDPTVLYNLPPDIPLYDSSGGLFWGSSFDNPEAYLRQHANSNTDNLLGNGVLRYKLLPGLDLKTSLGYSHISMKQVFTFPQSTQHPQDSPPSFTRLATNGRTSYVVEPQADYTLRIAKGSLHALAGGTWQQTASAGTYAEGQGYPSENDLGSLKLADTILRKPDVHMMYRYVSFFSRFTYDWQGRYIVNASYRRDGSSRFGPGNQFGNFGAVGLAWVFSEEPCMKKLTWLSHGKLRASSGITGNDQIPDYQYMSNYGVNGIYEGNNTLYPLRISNSNYSWEVNRKAEAALELGFLKDRIFFSASHFLNHSSNQLVGYQLPGITGFVSYLANLPARVENKGWEFELNTTNIQQQNFNWTSSFNISFFTNRLKAFSALATSSYANDYVIGQSLNIARGYHFLGVDPQTGVAQFKDINSDGSLTSGSDFTTIAQRDPAYYGGLSNNLHYKQFSLTVFTQFIKQVGQVPTNTPGDLKNETSTALQRWHKPGDLTRVPRATTTPGNVAYDADADIPLSNAAFTNASYIRLRNVSLSYEISAASLKRLHLQHCRLFVQGENLVTFTGYKGADPETQIGLPPLKIATVGVELTL